VTPPNKPGNDGNSNKLKGIQYFLSALEFAGVPDNRVTPIHCNPPRLTCRSVWTSSIPRLRIFRHRAPRRSRAQRRRRRA
jgi:hypothetical protein